MESKVFCWLCVNVFVRALHAELAVEGEQRCVRSCCLQCRYLFMIYDFSSCWVSLALNPRELCSFFSLRYLRYLCLCLRIALRIGGLCYLCGFSVISLCYLCDLVLGTLCYRCAISCYLCAISMPFLWYFFEIFVYTPCYLFLKLDVRNSQFQIWWCPMIAHVRFLSIPWGPNSALYPFRSFIYPV